MSAQPQWPDVEIRRFARVVDGLVDPTSDYFADLPLIAPDLIESDTGALAALVPSAAEQGAISGKGLVRAGQVVYSKIRPTLNKVVIAPIRCLCSADMYPLELNPNLALPRFVQFAMLSRSFVDAAATFSERVAMPKVNRETLAALTIPLPPVCEQQSISEFLDRETAQIDAMIDALQRLVDRLRERRRAILKRTVTFGVRRSQSVSSGTWVAPEMPETWRALPVKHALESLDTKRVPLSSEDRADRKGEYPYFGASGVIDYVDDYLFDEELVLVSEDGANLLARSTPIAFTAQGLYWVNNHAHVLRPRFGQPAYWAARLDAIDVAPVVTGSAQPKLTADALGNLRVTVPRDPAELVEITEHLGVATSDTDALIRSALDSITLLRERRAALITAAVTGHIDPRTGVERLDDILEGAAS